MANMASADEHVPHGGISTAQARQLSVLWTQAHPIVAAYFRSSVRDPHRAEDLLQETAASVAEKFTEYDSTRPFIAWVLGFARNKLLHFLRTQSHDRLIFDDAVIQKITSLYAEMAPELSAMQTALDHCVERVQGRQRKLLEMRYVREMTPAMIANLTGMNSNAVAVMLHRVRRTLRLCIERQLSVSALQGDLPSGGRA